MICFFGRLVPANAMNAWKSHGDTRLVTRRWLHGIKCHLEHQFRCDRTYRPEPVRCVVADKLVQFLRITPKRPSL